MNKRHRALLLFLSAVVGILLVDLYWLMRDGYGGTISHALFTLSLDNPIVPFVFGVFAGHMFWPNESWKVKNDANPKPE